MDTLGSYLMGFDLQKILKVKLLKILFKNLSYLFLNGMMKLINKITKSNLWWTGELLDGTTVPLVSPRSDGDIQTAVSKANWHCNNIFKIKTDNRYIPLWHPLGGYTAYEGTTVVFW